MAIKWLDVYSINHRQIVSRSSTDHQDVIDRSSILQHRHHCYFNDHQQYYHQNQDYQHVHHHNQYKFHPWMRHHWCDQHHHLYSYQNGRAILVITILLTTMMMHPWIDFILLMLTMSVLITIVMLIILTMIMIVTMISLPVYLMQGSTLVYIYIYIYVYRYVCKYIYIYL